MAKSPPTGNAPDAQLAVQRFLEDNQPNRSFVMIFDHQGNNTTNLVWGSSIDRVLLLNCLRDFLRTEAEALQKELANLLQEDSQFKLPIPPMH